MTAALRAVRATRIARRKNRVLPCLRCRSCALRALLLGMIRLRFCVRSLATCRLLRHLDAILTVSGWLGHGEPLEKIFSFSVALNGRPQPTYGTVMPWSFLMSPGNSPETLRFRDFDLDVAAYELRRRGRSVRLE